MTSAEVSPAWPPGISWASICVSNQRKNQEDHPSLIKINDKKAVDIITGKLGKNLPVDQEILKYNIRSFLDQGISLRQISRITAISRTVLYRLLKEQ